MLPMYAPLDQRGDPGPETSSGVVGRVVPPRGVLSSFYFASLRAPPVAVYLGPGADNAGGSILRQRQQPSNAQTPFIPHP